MSKKRNKKKKRNEKNLQKKKEKNRFLCKFVLVRRIARKEKASFFILFAKILALEAKQVYFAGG